MAVAALFGQGAQQARVSPPADRPPVPRSAPHHVNPTAYENLQALIETNRGAFAMRFYPHEAPVTVANFVQLAKSGFYNGLAFHARDRNFILKGGDPSGFGDGGPGYTIPAEFNRHANVPGTVAMARNAADPNSAGSQFYICLARAKYLDGKFTVFGQVTDGMDTVLSLRKGDTIKRVSIVAER